MPCEASERGWYHHARSTASCAADASSCACERRCPQTRVGMNRMPFTIDIEPTNRCNAKCHFCPRDQTPHEGLMSREVFDQSLQRAIEYREIARDQLDATVRVSLCGL